MRVWKITQAFLLGATCLLSQVPKNTRLRVLDPAPLAGPGDGWSVEPITGRLRVTMPVASLPGGLPLAVQFNAAKRKTTYSYTFKSDMSEYTNEMEWPIYSTLRLGGIGKAGANQERLFVLETGQQWLESDLVTGDKVPGLTGMTLLNDFGMTCTVPGSTRYLNNGGLAVVNLGSTEGFGALKATVDAVVGSLVGLTPEAPQGAGEDQKFVVMVNREVIRVYVHIKEMQQWIPILIKTRYGQRIEFAWEKTIDQSVGPILHTITVKCTNHLSNGYQLSWDVYRETPSGMVTLVQGQSIGGLEAPTVKVMGTPITSTVPYEMVGFKGLPSTITVGTRQWALTYKNGRIDTLKSPMNVLTTFAYENTVFMHGRENDFFEILETAEFEGVSNAVSVAGDQTLNQGWNRPSSYNEDDRSDKVITITAGWGNPADPNYASSLPTTVLTYDGSDFAKLANQVLKKTEYKTGTVLDRAVEHVTVVPANLSGSDYITSYVKDRPVNGIPVDREGIFDTGKGNLVIRGQNLYLGTNPPVAVASTSYSQKPFPDQLILGVPTGTTEVQGNGYAHFHVSEWYPDSDKDRRDRPKQRTFRRYDAGADTLYQDLTWDESGRPSTTGAWKLSAEDQASSTTTTTYDPTTGEVDKTTQTFKNKEGALESIITSVPSRDSMGRPTGMKVEDGGKTLTSGTTYDLWGRTTSTTNQGLTTTVVYDDALRTRTTTAPDGRSTVETYDGFGRLVQAVGPDGGTETRTYDVAGRLYTTRWESFDGIAFSTRTLTYDGLGRPLTRTVTRGKKEGDSQTALVSESETFAYVAPIKREQVQNLLETTRTFTTGSKTFRTVTYTDVLGNVVAVEQDGHVTTTTYAPFGEPLEIKIKDPSGREQTRSFTYGSLGRLKSKTEPETGTQTFDDFNAAGQPGTITEAGGRKRLINYDGLGRTVGVKAEGAAPESLSFTFLGSRLDTATSTDAEGKTITQTYGYDSDGRLTSEALTQGCFSATIGYQYDSQGRLWYLIYPSGLRVEYIYEVAGGMNRLAQVKVKHGDFTENLATFEYDATSGARTKVAFASQSRTDWSVDAVGRPFAWSLKNRAGTEVRAGAYAFNGGQITSAGDWKDMTYDNLGRITGATSTFAGRPTITATMAHDGFGNQIRNVSSPVSGDMLTWSLDPDDANLKGHNWMPLTTKTDVLASVDTGWSTNAQGEAEVVGMGTGGVDLLAMQWDKLGRLNRVRCETKNLEQKYSYAPSGLRVDRKDIRVPDSSRKFVYTTEGMLLSVLNGQGAWVKDVVYAGGEALAEIDATGIHELHNDHLGTPKMVTNRNTGLVEGEYLYGPYGELVATKPGNNGSTYPITTGYTGHLSQDSTGLIYMRGRYYSPTWHRFVNSDQGVDPMSFNQMAYVGGDPFGAMDPSGMKKMKKGEQYVDSYGRTWTCVADECDTDTSNVKGAGWELNGTVEVIGAHPGKAHPGKDEAIWNYNLTYFGTANLNWRNIHPSYGSPNLLQTPNQKEIDCRRQAALKLIRQAEHGRVSDKDYYRLFGGGSFTDISTHPNTLVTKGKYSSTAAGAYQILYSSWQGYVSRAGAHDFSPASQDAYALWTIDTKRHMLGRIDSGNILGAISGGLNREWVSLPGGSQSHMNTSTASNLFNGFYNDCISK